MSEENNRTFRVVFKEEFDVCLDRIERGSFKGLRRITYGRSKHVFLNYLIYYAVLEQDRVVDVINILPARTKRKRVSK